MTLIETAVLWQAWQGALARIWDYLNRELRLGRISISIAGVITAAVVITVTIAMSRYVSTFVERRLEKRLNRPLIGRWKPSTARGPASRV